MVTDKQTSKANKPVEQDNLNGSNRNFSCTTTLLLIIIALLSGACLGFSSFILLEKIPNNFTLFCGFSPERAQNITPRFFVNNTSNDIKIIRRFKWGASRPISVTPLKTPVPNVIILHTTTRNCSDFKTCAHIVKTIQNSHKTISKFWDIGYNFLIGGDNYVYEGRGFKTEGAFLRGYNYKSIGIAFIGNFEKSLPNNETLEIAKRFINFGVKQGFIQSNYTLFGARQLAKTTSPGDMLYENIQTWPHWLNKTNDD